MWECLEFFSPQNLSYPHPDFHLTQNKKKTGKLHESKGAKDVKWKKKYIHIMDRERA